MIHKMTDNNNILDKTFNEKLTLLMQKELNKIMKDTEKKINACKEKYTELIANPNSEKTEQLLVYAEKQKACRYKWRENNRDKYKEMCRVAQAKYRENHKEKIREYKKQYYLKKKQQIVTNE
jgi:hypothetical protein